jgi:hypothetical protein
VFTLDELQFAKADPEAVALVGLITDLYIKEEEATRFVATWIAQKDIVYARGKTPREFWEYLIEKLARDKNLRACVQAAYEQHYNQDKGRPEAKFLQKLLDRRKYDLGDDEEAAKIDPCEFLGLFNRSTEHDLLRLGLLPLVAPPFPPIVIGILAERADEHVYFVRRATAELLQPFLGGTGASQDSDQIEWSEPLVTAEWEIRKIATKKLLDGFKREGNGLEPIAKVISRLGPALGSRTATLELSTKKLAQDKVRNKLREFLGYWRSFAAQPQPPVLYVVAVRYDEADPSPSDLEPKLIELFDAAGCGPVTPFTLSECEPDHFAAWRKAITEHGRKIHDARYAQVVNYFTKSFRLRALQDRLREPDGRIHI